MECDCLYTFNLQNNEQKQKTMKKNRNSQLNIL